MDWLEEKIEKLKEYLRNAGLVRSLICYVCITSVGAVALWMLTRNLCEIWMQVIGMRNEDGFYYELSSGGKIAVSQSNRGILNLLLLLYHDSLWIYMFLAYIIAGKIFFAKKLRPALEAISDMISALNAGDYSKEMGYHSKDEIGKISVGMEELRKKLVREKQRQWEGQEEQRSINAAFAHDIRTPLTVILGYTEFLQKYVPQGKVSQELLLEKLDTMQYQEERLLRFSNTMTQLQQMEKREIYCQWIKFSDLLQRLREAAEAVEQTAGKRIGVHAKQELEEKEILVDSECVQEVVENLLNNAVRYAGEQIVMQLEINKTELTIYVKDDGAGFSQKALREATEAYYSEEKKEEMSSEHFGIGLSICKILCENHNGSITLRNSIEGGAIVAATFGIGRI